MFKDTYCYESRRLELNGKDSNYFDGLAIFELQLRNGKDCLAISLGDEIVRLRCTQLVSLQPASWGDFSASTYHVGLADKPALQLRHAVSHSLESHYRRLESFFQVRSETHGQRTESESLTTLFRLIQDFQAEPSEFETECHYCAAVAKLSIG